MIMFRFVIYRKVATNFNISLTRQVRSIVKRENQGSKFLKGKVVTLDNDVAERFGPIKNYEDLNRSLRRMFIEPEEVQSEAEMNAEEDYTAIPDVGKLFDAQKREKKDYRNFARWQILERKFFKDPLETPLLTYAAKAQIRFLHNLNPEEWTPDKLAESFPVSVSGIKKLLKCNPPPPTNEWQVKIHDDIIEKRWEALKSNADLSDFSPITLKLWREGKLKQDFYAGNAGLPQAPEIKFPIRSKKIGEYGAMVKKYVDNKKEKERKALQKVGDPRDLKSSNVLQMEPPEIPKSEEQMLQKLYIKRPTRGEMEDPESASYLATDELNSMEPDILSNQFEENLTEEFFEKKYKSSFDQAYMEWMEKSKSAKLSHKVMGEIQPYDANNYTSVVKKFDLDNTIELSRDQTANKSNVAYLYDANIGYQHPFGKEVVQDRIKIPQHLYKKGVTYKVGLCFYDEQGHFLYKLPSEINVDS